MKLVPIDSDTGPQESYEWDFLKIESGMKGAGQNFEKDLFSRMMKYVGTGDQMVFKALSQSKSLLFMGVAAGLFFVSGILLFTVIVGRAIGWLQTPGVVITIFAGLGSALVIYYLGRKVNWLAYLSRIILGVIMLGPGWLFAWFNLFTIDKLFLKSGRIPEKPRFKN